MTIWIFFRNSASKLIFIVYFSSYRPGFTCICQFWPYFDLWWPELTSNNFEFDFFTKFWGETYVYCIYCDLSTQFDLNSTVLTEIWPLMTFGDLIWPQIISNLNSSQNFESKHMNLEYISTNWLGFDHNSTVLTL